MHHACDRGDIKLVSQLLSRPDVEVNRRSYSGHTPLHLARGRGHLQIVLMMMDAGALYGFPDISEDNDDDIDDEDDAW